MRGYHLEVDGKPVEFHTPGGQPVWDDMIEALNEALCVANFCDGKPVDIVGEDGSIQARLSLPFTAERVARLSPAELVAEREADGLVPEEYVWV